MYVGLGNLHIRFGQMSLNHIFKASEVKITHHENKSVGENPRADAVGNHNVMHPVRNHLQNKVSAFSTVKIIDYFKIANVNVTHNVMHIVILQHNVGVIHKFCIIPVACDIVNVCVLKDRFFHVPVGKPYKIA